MNVSAPAISNGESSRAGSSSGVSPQVRALDALLDRSAGELETMYLNAKVPRIEDVHGDLRGRMLAWPSLDSRPRIAAALRASRSRRRFAPPLVC